MKQKFNPIQCQFQFLLYEQIGKELKTELANLLCYKIHHWLFNKLHDKVKRNIRDETKV